MTGAPEVAASLARAAAERVTRCGTAVDKCPGAGVVISPMCEIAFVRNLQIADVRPATKVAGCYVISRYNADEGGAWPSFETIARDCRMSLASAKRAVAELEATGWFVVTRRRRPGRKESQSNHYMPNLERAADPWRGEARPSQGRPEVVSAVTPRSVSRDTLTLPIESTQRIKNLRLGTFAEGEPHRGASVAGSPTHHQPSPVDNCGRTAEQHEPPEPGFKDRPSWYASQEPDDDLPEPAYAPEPEPELPSRELERKLGGKPPVGSAVHGIWRLQRRLEGVCRKVGASPFAIEDHACGEGLEELLEMQAANHPGLGRDLAMLAGLDFHEKAEFFERRGQC